MIKKFFVATFITSIAALLCGWFLQACGQQPQQQQQVALESEFINPPEDQRVGCYWYWIDKTITKEGVLADLQAMKKAGITRAYIGLTGGGDDLPFMSDQWWDLIHFTLKTAGENGVEIGSFNCPGWSQSGGPWIKPNQSMRYLAAVRKEIAGPQKFSGKLSVTDNDLTDIEGLKWSNEYYQGKPEDFEDVKTLAFPVKKEFYAPIGVDVVVNGNVIATGNNDGLKTAQSLQVNIKGAISGDGELLADGKSVKKFKMDRTDNGLSRGFKPYAPIVVTFPEIAAKEFKAVFSNVSRGEVVSATLTASPVIERYPEKTFQKMFNSLAPPWDAFMWETETADTKYSISPKDVIDISDKLQKDGTLNWDVPAGDWVVLRTGMVTTGIQNSPAPKGASGLECDKLSSEWTAYHHEKFIGEIIRRIPAEDRKTFKVNVLDSYEKGGTNWTDDFINIFKQRYGYDPTPFIPAYYGFPIGSPELSDRFLWDMRRLVADRIAYEYVKTMREKSHRDGLTVWLENYGSWGFAGEFLQYGGQADEVGGEFWRDSYSWLGMAENRCASSCANIYGKKKTWAEAFTAGGGHYTATPGILKAQGDRAFSDGINAYILHVNIHQQPDDAYPGADAWYAVQFNRKNTWFGQMDLFTDYIRRCGVMLQQGLNVADAAYFIGEDAPKMQGICDPQCPNGFHYDFINAEVLAKAKVVDKKLTLPHGTTYKVLVLPPQEEMRPEILKVIVGFAKQGLPIVWTKKPVRSPSMEKYPQCDEEVKRLAAKLPASAVLSEALEQPDFAATNSMVRWTHRRDGNTDIYFVSNQHEKQRIYFNAAFRTAGRQPELWNPVTLEIRKLPFFSIDNGITTIPMQLEPSECVFIVFREPLTADNVPKKLAEPVVPKVEIVKATYGVDDSWADEKAVADAVWKLTNGFTRSISVREVTQKVGDPKNGTVKTLTVTYLLDGKEHTDSALDNGMLDLLATVKVEGVERNFPEAVTLLEVNTPWTVTFESDSIKRGPSEPVVMRELTDWSKSENVQIKYFSGTAVYKNTFTIAKEALDAAVGGKSAASSLSTDGTNSSLSTHAQKPVWLDLGKVGAMAKVKVNGKDAGGVWTPPYRVNIEPYLQAGKNELEIEVVNTWANRIIGDRNLPEADRKLRINRGPADNAPLMQSGLLGPVSVNY